MAYLNLANISLYQTHLLDFEYVILALKNSKERSKACAAKCPSNWRNCSNGWLESIQNLTLKWILATGEHVANIATDWRAFKNNCKHLFMRSDITTWILPILLVEYLQAFIPKPHSLLSKWKGTSTESQSIEETECREALIHPGSEIHWVSVRHQYISNTFS